MSTWFRIMAIARKEVRQLIRDRITIGMIVGIPMLQLTLFGFAINTDVRHLAAAVADQANTSQSRQLVLDAQGSQVIDIKYQVQTAAEIESLIIKGEITVGLLIPPDMAQRATQNRPMAQLLVDGSTPMSVNAVDSLRQLPARNGQTVNRSSVFEVRTFFNPERRSAVYIVPGLIGVILMMTMTMFTAIAIVREKERGNMELLITTPVKRLELMIGKILPYIAIGLVQTTIVLYTGAALFDVPINGSILDVYLAAGVFIAATLSLGLLMSTIATTQFQAMQMTFLLFLSSVLMSGFMFPYEGMPRAARAIAELLPLTPFIRLIHGIILKGAGLMDMWYDVFHLLVFTVVVMAIAIMKFNKSLD